MQDAPFDIHNAVFIVDGSSFLYRAYYSMRPMHTSNGLAVQAVYGYCRMLKKIIAKFNPSSMVIVWDSKGKTVRHELFQEYKATRQAAPQDLTEQKGLIQEFNKDIGLCQVELPGAEADDLIFSLARDVSQVHRNAVLITSDKDLGQAIEKQIVIYDPFKEVFVTQQALQERYGFEVSKIPFYFSLVGDSSDNIPGVRGIGPKGAQELVKSFDSLEHLYASLD
ncbi:MAG TPA: 5'-3' exonuclease, partial [Candidatus Babeliaceae bacterium]|nr:5'-3' exonuclease [Candidatus Babeliaceae bacterium]